MSSTLSSSPNDQGSRKSSKKRKDEDDEETSTSKKPRVVWTMELHQQFVAAVNHLGIDKAFPMKILELMNVRGLSRENVASHLQKYRIYLRKLCGISQNQNGPITSFQTSADAANGLELLALASSGQLPAESLATLHAAAFTRPATSSAISTPLIERRNRFSFKQNNLRIGNGQQGTSDINKQVSLGMDQEIPTNMEARDVGNFYSTQPYWGMNVSSQANQSISPLMEMTQLQSSGQVLNQNIDGQVPGFHSSNGIQLLSNTMPGVWTPNSVSQVPSMVDYSMNQIIQIPTPGFSLTRGSGVTTPQPNPGPDLSSWRSRGPDYDRFSELYFKKMPDVCTQSAGSTFHASQPMASQGECSQPGGEQSTTLGPVNPALASTSITPENPTDPGCESNLFLESSIHDDMMSILLEQSDLQQQDGLIPNDTLGYNGYF